MNETREALVKVVGDLEKANESRELRMDEVVVKQEAERRIWNFNRGNF